MTNFLEITNGAVFVIYTNWPVPVTVCDWNTQTSMFFAGVSAGTPIAATIAAVFVVCRAIWGRKPPFPSAND